MNDPKKTAQDAQFVTLAYFSNAPEAGMVCELLKNNGIDAILKGANFGALEPLRLVGGFSEIRLIVPATEFDRAQEIYNAFFGHDQEILKENEDVGNK